MSKQYENLIFQLDKLHRHNRQGSFRTRQRYSRPCSGFAVSLPTNTMWSVWPTSPPKHVFAYVARLQEKGRSASTIKTDLSAIRFFHDLISSPRYELPRNDALILQRRTFGEVDRTWSNPEFNRMLMAALGAGREDYVTILYLGRYAALRIHECFRIDTATAGRAVKENTLTIKGKGGLERTVPLNDLLVNRLQLHLKTTPRGHKLFVADNELTHEAIKRFQAFIYLQRQDVQDPDSTRPMTFHGLRHTKAAEWYQEFLQEGKSPYEARKAVSRLLGHGRDDVTRIYLASVKEKGGHNGT